MRTGRLSISRGHQLAGAAAPGPRLSIVPRPQPERFADAPLASPEFQPVHDRLSALERLARLRDVLTEEEFAAEKAAILALGSDALVLNEPLIPPSAPRGPTLLGRLLGWKLIPVGLVAGVALSLAAQPRETSRFFEEAVRLFNA